MKKKIVQVISCFLSLLFLILTSTAVCAESSTPGNVSVDEWNDWNSRYFSFIYTNDEGWAWFREYIGPNECEEGYLYVKDTISGRITKLLNEPARAFDETYDDIYCITESNKIIKVPHTGGAVTVLYEAQQGELTYIEHRDALFMFLEDEKVMAYHAVTNSIAYVTTINGICAVIPVSETEFLWHDAERKTNVCDMITGEQSLLETEEEIEAYFPVETKETENETNVLINLSVHPSYPAGSYYTKHGAPCTDHNLNKCSYTGDCNCKPYYGSIQCAGFAQHMYDYYSHKSGFNRVAGDNKGPIGCFKSEAEINIFFESLTPGAYVRLSGTPNDTGSGDHSIVFMKISNGTVYSYECNKDGQCGVSTPTRTASYILKKYPCIVNASSHNYTGTVSKYMAMYHKVACKSSGCGGYIYEEHSALNPGDNATCVRCGYVGRITKIGTLD